MSIPACLHTVKPVLLVQHTSELTTPFAGTIPPLGNLSSLVSVKLDHTMLSGAGQGSFTVCLCRPGAAAVCCSSARTGLKSLLHAGSLPSDWWSAESLHYFDASHCNLSGRLLPCPAQAAELGGCPQPEQVCLCRCDTSWESTSRLVWRKLCACLLLHACHAQCLSCPPPSRASCAHLMAAPC